MTPDEADKAFDESPAIPISDDEVERLVEFVASPQAVVIMHGFTKCIDGLYRRVAVHDNLVLGIDEYNVSGIDEYRISVYAETDDQSVKIGIASFDIDGEALARFLMAIGSA